MSIDFKDKLLSALVNAKLLSKTTADTANGKISLDDLDAGNSSGSSIDNVQKYINQLADSSGESEGDVNRKIYSSTNFIINGDSRKVAIGKLDSQVGSNDTDIQAINDSIGQPDGIAPLDSSGVVPAANLPSYVDDVEEYADLASFPATGETGKIYVALDTNITYRWSGSVYIEISPNLIQSVNGQTGIVFLDNTDIGLGNVTNDAQLKREGGDLNTFTEKVTPVVDDIVLIEDSEDSFNKKKVKLQNMLGGGGGGGLDTYYTQDFESFQITDIVDTGTDTDYGVNSVDITAKLSIETTDPIAGDQSLQYVGTGTDAGDWVAIENITVRDRERAVQSARNVWLDNKSSSEINLIAYDVTNGAVIKEQIAAANSNLQKYLIEFIVPETCNEIQVGFQVVDNMVASEFMVIDNIELTTDPFVYTSIEDSDTVRMYSANGYGSTATKILRMSLISFYDDAGYVFSGITTEQNSPNQLFKVLDDGTDSTRIEMLRDCHINTGYSFNSGGDAWSGITLNDTQLTTNVSSMTGDEILAIDYDNIVTGNASASWSGNVKKGSILRLHTNGQGGGTPDTQHFFLSAKALSQNVVTPSKSNLKESTDYVPFTQGIGSPTIINASYTETGDRVRVIALITLGVRNASELQIGLPNSYTIKTGSANVIGSLLWGGGTAGGSYTVLGTAGDNFVNIGYDGDATGALVPRAGNTLFTDATNISLEFEVAVNELAGENQFLSLIPFTTEFKTLEQSTGKKWVDGKPIYELTIDGSFANDTVIVSGVETLIDQNGSFNFTGTRYIAIPYENNGLFSYFQLDTSTEEIKLISSLTTDIKAVIRYTKA